MTHYKCTNSFQSINNGYFGYGQRIGQHEYGNLDVAEQRNFTKVEDESYSSSSVTSEPPYIPPVDYGSATVNNDSNSYSTSNDSNESFGGYGGGSFGGGGASGSWDSGSSSSSSSDSGSSSSDSGSGGGGD